MRKDGLRKHVSGLKDKEFTSPYIVVRVPSCPEDGWSDVCHSWVWPGHEGEKVIVGVYSMGSYVELFQDGHSLLKKALKSSYADFETVYKPGELLAIAYDKQGNVIGEDTLSSPDSKI